MNIKNYKRHPDTDIMVTGNRGGAYVYAIL